MISAGEIYNFIEFSRKKACALFIFLFLFLGSVFGQGVTITSPQSPGPTFENPIEVFLSFKDAVNNPIGSKLDLTNGILFSQERLVPEFENFDFYNLPNENIQASLEDFFLNFFNYNPFDFENSYNEQLQQQLQEYLVLKFKNLIVAFDINSDGEIFYLTFANGVFKYKPNGNDEQVISNEFESPIDILIDNEDRILVADTDAYAVKVFNSSDYSLLFEMGGVQGADGNEFYGPTGLAVNSDNNIYVADTYPGDFTGNDPNNKVKDKIKVYQITNSGYNYLDFFGVDKLDDPFRIAVDSKKNIYVSDSGGNNGRIRIFSSDGILRNTIAEDAEHSPSSIAIDSYGYIYVADYDGDITFNGIYQDPLDLIIKFEDLKGKSFPIDVYEPLADDYSTDLINSFDSNLKLPVDLSLNQCENILVLDLDFSGDIDNADLDFDIELFRRNDNFKIELEPTAEGIVEVELGDFEFFTCNPQPSGQFSIVYKTEEENVQPEITCPDDITKNNDPGQCGALVTFAAPEVTDDGGAITPTRTDGSGYNSGDLFPIGETTISYQADDGVNDPVACSFTITVNDNEDPVINCPADISENIASGETGLVIDYAQPTFDDNCETSTLTQTAGFASGEEFPIGTTVNTFVVKDGNGNTKTCSFNVVIIEDEEDTPPEITCPENITRANDPGECGSIVTFAAPEVTDDGGAITPTRTDGSGYNSGDLFPIGETTISYQADDGVNDPVTCSFTITVIDNEKPFFTQCPSETIVMYVEQGETGAIFEAPEIEATDNCGAATITQTEGPDGGEILPLGITNFEFTAIDESGLTATCNFNVEVVVVQENTLTLSCTDNYEIFADENCQYLVPDFSEIVSVSPADATIEQSIPSGSTTITNADPFITITATYEGQTETCNIYLTLRDEISPEVNCLPDQTIELSEGDSYILPDYRDDLEISENCGIADVIQDPEPGSEVFGDTQISFIIIDEAGNSGGCNFQLTYEEEGGLEISCLIVEFKLTPDENCEYFLPDLSSIVEYSPSNADFEQSIAAGTQLFSDEEVEVTVSLNGEVKVCNVYVSLNLAPPQAICRSEFQIQLEEDETVTIQPDDLDDGSFASCSDVSLSLDKTVFNSLDEGTNIVTLTVTDELGNTATCETEVLVVVTGPGVNQPPVAFDDEYFTGINTSLEVPASTGVLENDTDQENDDLIAILDDDVSNGVLDLREDGSFTYTPEEGFTGQDYFTYVANDGEFDSNIIFVSINVVDNNGDFSCVDRIALNLDSEGLAELNTNNLYTGNAEGIELDVSQQIFSCDDIGENTVTLIYTGSKEGSCEIIVEVMDISAPVLALRDIEISLNQAGVASILFRDLDAGSSDNCNGEVTYILSQSAFTCKELGENQVQVTAEDSSGNSSTRTATVTVLDNEGYCNDTEEGSEFIFIYPNPNTGSFRIATPADVFIERVEVFDHRGRFIAARDFERTATEYALNLGALQESVYVVKIVTNENTLTKRMIFKY